MFAIVVGGSQDFIEESREAAKNVNVKIIGESSSVEGTGAMIRKFSPHAVLIPSVWAKETEGLVKENKNTKVFVSGGIKKSRRDEWDELGLPVLVVPGKIHRALLDLEAHLKFTSPTSFRFDEPEKAAELPPTKGRFKENGYEASQLQNNDNGSEKKQENEAAKKSEIASEDPLTGCHTRACIENFKPWGVYSVVFIDLDKFKPVNDILGHEAGDRVLAAFGQALRANLKGRDVAVRYGGDEFLLILPDTSPKEAEKVIENLRSAWEKVAPDTGNLRVGFSAGISEAKETLTDTIKTADRAMYQSKNSARQVLSPVMQPIAAGGAIAAQPETLLQIAGKVISLLIKIFTVCGLLSFFVWFVNSIFKIIGVQVPVLETIAKIVINLWKDLFVGFL